MLVIFLIPQNVSGILTLWNGNCVELSSEWFHWQICLDFPVVAAICVLSYLSVKYF